MSGVPSKVPDEIRDVEAGEEIPLAREQVLVCCDCGLAHTMTIRRADDGFLRMSFRRDNDATLAERKRTGRVVVVRGVPE